MERRRCCHPGCPRPGRNKGFYRGRIRYGRFCERHHRSGDLSRAYFVARLEIENQKCERCGWDKAPCDRHRIEPELGYAPSNVLILCPNCHRLVTLGLDR